MTPGIDSVGIVVGNPKPRSRTREVAETVAAVAGAAVGLADAERVVVDLAEFGPLLFDSSSTRVRSAVDADRRVPPRRRGLADLQGQLHRLLKSFLDWFSTTGLQGATVIPLMVGAGPQLALAVEVHLRPVLVEIGATLPTRGLYVTEAQLVVLQDVIGEWLAEAAPGLRASLGLGPR